MESVISQKIKRTKGKDVWRENLRLVIVAADKVRSTLGPKGSCKMVVYNRGPEQEVKVTLNFAILEFRLHWQLLRQLQLQLQFL
jgi:hypothetical protein